MTPAAGITIIDAPSRGRMLVALAMHTGTLPGQCSTVVRRGEPTRNGI